MKHEPVMTSSRGRRLRMSEERGRAVVVFYEAHGHTRDNEALKRACGRLIESRIHGDRLTVLGVADLRGLGGVRPLVRSAVKQLARSYGVEVWMDFDGALAELGPSGSAVAVFGPDGARLFTSHGPLSRTEIDHFYSVLGEALARASRAA